jgi:hypothetical protein
MEFKNVTTRARAARTGDQAASRLCRGRATPGPCHRGPRQGRTMPAAGPDRQGLRARRGGGSARGRHAGGGRRGELTTGLTDGSNRSLGSTLGQGERWREVEGVRWRLLCVEKREWGRGAHGGGRGRLGHAPRLWQNRSYYSSLWLTPAASPKFHPLKQYSLSFTAHSKRFCPLYLFSL